jgi:hypothetical protein
MRKKMKIRYWFRKARSNLKDTIYGTVAINQEHVQPFRTGIRIDKFN